ncbi:cytochrome c oxidase assembly protein [Brevundimonas sp.]|uniref:cytochrome c oxidase assembly protein n=1 Tax=Brevundimonas sp. TaxID=1871086 RepID=UPI001D2D8F48|nr:cytochrome c oxidase assembly protein [Brevundimonas sp.]MBL0946985.1 cytochrome c oxidase assembly protein [Brevundimonas sp.]
MNTAYCGPPPLPADLWTSFNLDPVLLIGLVALGVAVRRHPPGLLAVAVLAIAFVSPLCALSSALFSARVVHHVLLIAVAAPLLALALPARRTGSLAVPFALSTVVLWVWHLPAAYDAALSNVPLYWIMQLTLFGSAVWFWCALLTKERSPVDQLVFVVAAFAQMGLLGAILTFASTPLYAAHAVAPLTWGLTPLEDQALGGLIMWVPAGIPYAVAAALLARRGWGRLREIVA